MGRRKKEPEHVHRETISLAAERLFLQKGIQAATMDDIAKEAGYSKATLYVYFTDKEEIVGFLVQKSMKMLCVNLSEAVSGPAPAKDKYNRICMALTRYQEQYPLYFQLALSEVNVDFDEQGFLPVEKEIFETGEEINRVLAAFIREGIQSGQLKPDIPVLQTVFLFWSSLSGLIQTAAAKQAYIKKSMGLSKQQFLEFGFGELYHLIERKDAE